MSALGNEDWANYMSKTSPDDIERSPSWKIDGLAYYHVLRLQF